MSQTEAIALYQPLLYSIALKMVGTLEDAEDIVQDTFEKYLSIDHKKIENTKAYLVKSVNNNCLKFLTSLKHRIARNTTSPEDHDALVDSYQSKSIFSFDQDAQLGEAWQVLQRKLAPIERSVFVLREVFNIDYDDLQHILDKKKDHCRQLFCRAKSKIEQETPKLKFDISFPQIPESFIAACNFGHLSEIISEFKDEMIDKFPLKKK
ncbi:MAG: sigma-70 family RNA polymerase sigma factor [Cyclobacteriaceae bacterium]